MDAIIKPITNKAKTGESHSALGLTILVSIILYIYDIKRRVVTGIRTTSVLPAKPSFVLTNMIVEKRKAENNNEVSINWIAEKIKLTSRPPNYNTKIISYANDDI